MKPRLTDNIPVIKELIECMLLDGENHAEVIAELERAHGARYRFISGAYELRVAGLSATCTYQGGVIPAWIRAAQRRCPA